MARSITFEKRNDGVGVLVIDVPGASQNTITDQFKEDFRVSREEATNANVKALVITTGKDNSFVAGADVQIIHKLTSAQEAEQRAKELQNALGELEKSRIPVVAAIHGACLGGGLELALACHARIASDSPETKLGLPEVQLGLLPAAGGTQRLPRTIGVERALDLMLTGKQIDARRAKKLGLVREVVPRAILVDVAAQVALDLASNHQDGRTLADRVAELADVKVLRELALVGNPAGRNIVFKQAEKDVRKRAGDNYPAPYKILEAARVGLQKGIAAGLEAEARLFGELVMSDVSRRLIEIFFATTELKKDPGTSDPSAAPRPIDQIGVLGAGLMGHGVACVTAARADLPVRLKDRDDESVGRGLRAIREILNEKAEKGRTDSRVVERQMKLVSGCTDYSGFKHCQVVIEAVFEDLKLKQKVLKEVEENTAPNTIFASNTSSIPIGKIAEASSHPENVVGMHYFSPVHKMPLLEVIRTKQTSEEVVATVVDLGKRQGKTVIVVNDGVGFFTSRILGPYMNEAAWLLAEGVPIEVIDEAATLWGFPVGPIALLDEVGLDTAAKVGKIALEAFGERMQAPGTLDRMITDGRTGRKGGRGFYVYGDLRRKKKGKNVDESVYEILGVKPNRKKKYELDQLGERLALQMVSESIRCLEENILRNPRDGDIGAIFGLGFPPFRGGPFRFADSLGPSELLRRVRKQEERHGKRFAPPQLLIERARSGQRFHG